MLRIGANFPKISLTDIENKNITIPDDINTNFCVLLFFRGAWWPKCTLQLEGYRKYFILFERLGASIIAANVDSLEDTKLVAEGKCFPNRGKAMPFTFCYGVTPEIAQTLGAYWYCHEKGKDKYYIMGENKDYMQPAEFVIDCNSKKIISCTYSDGGLGRMDAGDVIGLLTGIQDKRNEIPHVWSW